MFPTLRVHDSRSTGHHGRSPSRRRQPVKIRQTSQPAVKKGCAERERERESERLSLRGIEFLSHKYDLLLLFKCEEASHHENNIKNPPVERIRSPLYCVFGFVSDLCGRKIHARAHVQPCSVFSAGSGGRTPSCRSPSYAGCDAFGACAPARSYPIGHLSLFVR